MRLCWDAHIYPFVRKMIQEVLGDRVRVFDGGNGTAREMKRRLAEKGLLTDSTAAGIVDFQNSLTGQSHEDKIQLCKELFNKKNLVVIYRILQI